MRGQAIGQSILRWEGTNMNNDRHILKTIRVPILNLNKPTKSGLIYTTECIKKMLEDPILKERLANHALFGSISLNSDHDIFDISIFNISHAACDLAIESDQLMATIHILDTPIGRDLINLMGNNIVEFLACGDGESKDNIITKYDLASVNAKIRGDGEININNISWR